MIPLWYQAYCVPGLMKYLLIIPPQGIHTSELYKGDFIPHFHDEHDIYKKINLNYYKPYWRKAKPVDRGNINYDPNNNLPTHKYIIPNQR